MNDSLVNVPVSIPLEVGEGSALVRGIVSVMRESGLVAVGRTAPFTTRELRKETNLSETQIYRMIEAGTFERCKGTGKCLVTVSSARAWQGFAASKKEGGRK